MMSREIPDSAVLRAESAGTYGVSTSWLYELLARYRREGEAVFEPRSNGACQVVCV